ncbi:MAG: AcrR family transcriptional regulator [Marivirga sp.]|jgi:AcrR family transcriptional regulator
MDKLFPNIHIKVNEHIYLKNPESSELGLRLLSTSLELIHTIGLESFTFKKLAKALDTAESSIYRYFENKHKLLIYFINYYWAYLEYIIVFEIHNITAPEEQLMKALTLLSDPPKFQSDNTILSIEKLNAIVIAESGKAYLTKEVDEDNKSGFFIAFKNVSRRIVGIIKEIDPKIAYPNTLASTCLEGIIHQQFFAIHLPSLTDFNVHEGGKNRAHIFYQMIMNNLNRK